MSKKTTKVSKSVSKKTGKSAAKVAAVVEPVVTTPPAIETTGAAATVAPVGAKVVKQPKAPVAPREERNGVKRPKSGGACVRVWNHLDANGDMSVADIKAWAATECLNVNNAAIEIYGWRKFMGIKAVKAAKATDVQQAV